MSKQKIDDFGELLKDMDNIFNIIDDIENTDLKKLNFEKITKKAEYLKNNMEKKYKKYLDSKK